MWTKLFFVLLFLAAGFANVEAQSKTAPKITDLTAQLFYEANGTFSENLFAQKDLALWNTIIGEGSSGGASSSTLVKVEVSGRDVAIGKINVNITATGRKGRILQSKSFPLALYDEKTKFYAPLWLYDTGCEPITVTARLVGAGASKIVVKKTIPFACGE